MVILPRFHASPWFVEQVHETWLVPDVRAVLNAPLAFDPAKPTRLVVFTTPNGNTIEQTLGSLLSEKTNKTDWHFDIQHVAAQIRLLREQTPGENIALACLEATGLSWPAWRAKHSDNSALIRRFVDQLRALFPSPRVALTGHSGGGSFLFGFLNGGETIPDFVDTIGFLDANYSYSDTDRHGDKLLTWLRGDKARRLTVLAYDDREITLSGKKVVGPEGGTFRATERMRVRFARELPLTESKMGPVISQTGLGGQLVLRVHQNPKNSILHTALVGEWNGLLAVLNPTQAFSEPRRYLKFIQPAAGIPPRLASAPSGSEVFARLEKLAAAEREDVLAQELLRGNLPNFLRTFQPVVLGSLTCYVLPDYLAIGSDTDFIRTPLTPMTAQLLADAFGCTLPTKLLVDAIYQQAMLKLEPRPLTEAREAARTFVQHHKLIEEQRAGKPLGLLVAGIKKDVVLTNRLKEKPHKVAIYGWHKLDGQPIQPLTIVHRETYVDYSHGIRFVQRAALLKGKPCDLLALLHDPTLCMLLSDEGVLRD